MHFIKHQTDLSVLFSGCHKNDIKGWFHTFSCVRSKRLWRHVLTAPYFSCRDGFYFVLHLYLLTKKFMPTILCSVSKILTSGWRSHTLIEFGKPRLIFPCDSPHSVHIFDMEHQEWHNLIICNVWFVQVEIKTFKCGGATCNCGVAVRAGGDVFIINRCYGNDRKLWFTKCDDELLVANRINDNYYEVINKSS